MLYLEYEAFEEMAEPMLRALADELTAKHGLAKVAIHHRVGRVEIGEPSVVIAVSAPHRAAALDACSGGDRHAQGDDPALEEGVLRGRRGVDRTRIVNGAVMEEMRDYKPIQPTAADRARRSCSSASAGSRC